MLLLPLKRAREKTKSGKNSGRKQLDNRPCLPLSTADSKQSNGHLMQPTADSMKSNGRLMQRTEDSMQSNGRLMQSKPSVMRQTMNKSRHGQNRAENKNELNVSTSENKNALFGAHI
jgi:hypothetical protein